MKIYINNSLSSIHLYVYIIRDDKNKIQILVNTGAVMNKGNKEYHQWVIIQSSNMVTEYLEYGDDTEYNVVQLLNTFDFKKNINLLIIVA